MSRERTIQIVVGALCVVAFVAIFSVLGEGDIDETTGRVLAIALTLAIYVLLGLAGNRLRESGEPWSWLGPVAMVLCALGALTACTLWVVVGANSQTEEDVARAAGVFGVFAIVTSHGAMLVHHIGERSDVGGAVRYATFACGLIVATIITLDLIDDSSPGEEGSRASSS